MHIKNRCKYNKTCDIYQGKESIKMDLQIYRNVFCNRGAKGWNNCERYVALKNNEKTQETNE